MQPTFIWKTEYEIDGDIIDWEHKKLFDLANEVIKIDRLKGHEAEFKEAVEELYKYVQYHFSHEEELMKARDYELLEAHKKKHALIIAEMNHHVQFAEHMTRLLSNFRQLAYRWVVEHILVEDVKFRDFLRANQPA